MTRRVGIPLNSLTPTTFLYLSQARTGFPTSYVVVFNYMMWEVIVDHHCLEVTVCFVDLGGIDDHHCLEVIVWFVDIGGIVDPSLFRGDCLFCWYWWNCWPSLFRGDCLFCWYWWNWWPSLFRGDCLFCWYWWNCWPSLFRGDCLFCWYWCNCWPSLFTLSFLKNIWKVLFKKKKAQTGKIHSDDILSLHCLITVVFLTEK